MDRFVIRGIVMAAALVSACAIAEPAAARGENGLPRAPGPTGPAPLPTRYVATTGSDNNSCDSATAPCQTIAQAVVLIQNAGGVGTINIAAGTYVTALVLGDVALTLAGAGSGKTIIDAGNLDHVIRWTPTQDRFGEMSISGVTLQHGRTSDAGAGLYAAGSISLTLSDVVFNDNRCDLSATGCRGGGIYFDGVFMTLIDVTLTENLAGGAGSAIFFSNRNAGFVTTLTRVKFEQNHGGLGTIYVHAPQAPVGSSVVFYDDVTFSNNLAKLGSSIVTCGPYSLSGGSMQFTFNSGGPEIAWDTPDPNGFCH